MKIQVIQFNKTHTFDTGLNVTYTTLNAPFSLDEHDINIINLQNENIWRNGGYTNESIDSYDDFRSLKTMIINSSKATNIIALPQNCYFRYNYGETGYMEKGYREKKQLKDMLYALSHILLPVIIPMSIEDEIFYENTHTVCNESIFNAAFCFKYKGNIITKSDKSEKPTTIKFNDVIYTTLDIFSPKTKLEDLLLAFGLIDKCIEFPRWIHEFEFFDDEKQKKIIGESKEKIKLLLQKIDLAEERVQRNMRYKSILLTTGQQLVDAVFDILQQILDCDLSEFIDKKKEDFLIKKEDITFVGEIKGISTNVKTANISQIEVRSQEYQDDHVDETVKALLIINPLRTIDITQREPVGQHQIDVAVRYGSLIITTDVLLQVFNGFLSKKLSLTKIKKTFATKTGLLTLDDLK